MLKLHCQDTSQKKISQKLNDLEELNSFSPKTQQCVKTQGIFTKNSRNFSKNSIFRKLGDPHLPATWPNGNPELIAQLGQLFHLTGSKQ